MSLNVLVAKEKDKNVLDKSIFLSLDASYSIF